MIKRTNRIRAVNSGECNLLTSALLLLPKNITVKTRKFILLSLFFFVVTEAGQNLEMMHWVLWKALVIFIRTTSILPSLIISDSRCPKSSGWVWSKGCRLQPVSTFLQAILIMPRNLKTLYNYFVMYGDQTLTLGYLYYTSKTRIGFERKIPINVNPFTLIVLVSVQCAQFIRTNL